MSTVSLQSCSCCCSCRWSCLPGAHGQPSAPIAGIPPPHCQPALTRPAPPSCPQVSIAGGAAASGLVVTWVLPTTLEDLMALALAGMVGYLSVLGLPLRRAEAKRKLEALAASYAEVRGV